MISPKFKCIAVVLFFCLTLPIFAEDVFSFKMANSSLALFADNSESSKEETEINNTAFSFNMINSKEFDSTNRNFNLERMLTEADAPSKSGTNYTPIIITAIIIGGFLLFAAFGGIHY
jgi:hypothetical protein